MVIWKIFTTSVHHIFIVITSKNCKCQVSKRPTLDVQQELNQAKLNDSYVITVQQKLKRQPKFLRNVLKTHVLYFVLTEIYGTSTVTWSNDYITFLGRNLIPLPCTS
jgi:thioredoxin-related protein